MVSFGTESLPGIETEEDYSRRYARRSRPAPPPGTRLMSRTLGPGLDESNVAGNEAVGACLDQGSRSPGVEEQPMSQDI